MLAAAAPQPASAPPQDASGLLLVIDKQLVSTSIEGDRTVLVLPPDDSDIGAPIRFRCAKACTIVVNSTFQVGTTTPDWAICPIIDGGESLIGCIFQGASRPGSVVTSSKTDVWSLAAGKHTFQPRVHFDAGGTLFAWAMTIAEYQ